MLAGAVQHLEQSSYMAVTLTDGGGIDGFYSRFGFRPSKDATLEWRRKPDE